MVDVYVRAHRDDHQHPIVYEGMVLSYRRCIYGYLRFCFLPIGIRGVLDG